MLAFIPQRHTRSRSLGQRFYGWGVWCLLAMVLAVLVVFAGMGLRTPWARTLAHRLARTAFRLAGMPMRARGLRRLPRRPHVLLVNHSSFVDPLALAALLPPRYAFVTRRQFRSQLLLWPLVHCLGTVVLARPAGSYSANVKLLTDRLAAGESLVVFPEGRFRREPGLLAFHSGIFMAASAAGVPVVPAALTGTRAVLPLGSWLPRRAPLTLHVGQPMLPARHHPAAADALRNAARKAMLRLSGQPDAAGGAGQR